MRTDTDRNILLLLGKTDDLVDNLHTFMSDTVFTNGWKVVEQRLREQVLEDFALDTSTQLNESFDKSH